MNMYMRGRPWVLTIDDYLPFYNGALLLEQRNSDANFWAQLYEKAYAKINCNYENINAGW